MSRIHISLKTFLRYNFTMIPEIIGKIKANRNYAGQIASVREIGGDSLAVTGSPLGISDELLKYFEKTGITGLYSHQKDAYEESIKGKNIFISSGTSTGKTLAFNIPVLDLLFKNKKSTALYLYPTKALARDQKEKLDKMVNGKFILGTYDGDTPRSGRFFLRKNARLIITNPDLLHIGILPYHSNWARFFRDLKFIVLDEVHYYNGILGTHVSEVMRRLRRIANFYGAYPQFLLASATIGNPEEFSYRLIGENFEIIRAFELPPNKKAFVVFNPALVDKRTNTRRSAYKEAVWVLKVLVENNARTIAFARSRQGVELITKYLKSALPKEEKERIASYRAGYMKEERREIENKLKSGELLAVIATNALELGIDIGDLDATVIVGYPGTISSLFQESGRSGRKGESVTFFITSSNPLDQYFVKDPDYLFRKNFEDISVNPSNFYILSPHLKCAAFELPVEKEIDREYFGEKVIPIIDSLERENVLEKRGKRFYYALRDFPAASTDIRGSGGQEIALVDADTDEVLERISLKRALEEAFKGAVYLHMAETFVVEELNLPSKYAVLHRKKVNYYTDSLAIHKIEVIKAIERRKLFGIQLYFGDVRVSERVVGFIRKQYGTDRKIGTEEVELPEIRFETRAFWFPLSEDMENKIIKFGEEIPGSIHAVEHLLVAMMPLVVVCDRKDVGGVSHPLHPDTGGPTIFVYDGAEGGVGLAEEGFARFDKLVNLAYQIVANCSCEAGCPSCIYSPKCGNDNKPLSKKGAIILLKEMLYADM